LPFDYFHRLSAARKRIYLRSDALEDIPIPPGEPLDGVLQDIRAALEAERRVELERASQRLLDDLTARFQVPRVKVKVPGVRPSGDWGELHGLYEPGEEGVRAVISTWMRTVARRQPVAYRTFVRTLLHELCHHLDYEMYQMAETFHTEGFYKREASLFRQLHPGMVEEGGKKKA
jgi:hypothetical protein